MQIYSPLLYIFLARLKHSSSGHFPLESPSSNIRSDVTSGREATIGKKLLSTKTGSLYNYFKNRLI